MSYTPTNWQTGDTITAEKLNKLEGGVAALSGYDLEIHDFYEDDLNVITAQGLSPSELYGKYPDVKAVLLRSDSDAEVFSCSNDIQLIKDTYNEDIEFQFWDKGLSIILRIYLDGAVDYNTKTGTYTYSDGEYTFADISDK